VLFYAGGGLSTRINGSYASDYDYIFRNAGIKSGLYRVLRHILNHFCFNARYLWPAVPFFMGSCVVYWVLFRMASANSDKAIWRTRGSIIWFSLIYSSLFLGISSAIRVEDDLYGRFMSGIYLCIAIAGAQMVDTVIFAVYRSQAKIGIAVRLMVVVVIIMNVDMFIGFYKYNVKSAQLVHRLMQHPSSISIKESELEMEGSPLFGLRQFPFLQSWSNPTAFGVEIKYVEE
jgi:hypothetical protein